MQARKIRSELVRAVAGIGNNLNQIARNINGVVKVGALNQLDALTIITHLAATERALNAVRGYLEC
ncbi:plasmid mobilization relaxosome protein MobC [Snodgrassella gandavensis]|uniref:plasmid mobilization relaxosome protein MobC n=1 Tax=Snodgrassella gandavensis TaxID=2946698 RepID=UPI001EF4315F|nr:plasmid mobilization relaxosome protein MobC [Snodgrassella gandavensis]